MIGTLIVIAKRPAPGRVKTRLTPPLTPFDASRVAAAALLDTLRAVDAAPARHRLLAWDGPPDEWLPRGWRHTRQPPGGLDVRLGAAFDAAPSGPALLVGMDTPQLVPDLLRFDATVYDAALGRTADGGYWALAFRDPRQAAQHIRDVPMSTERTAAQQLARLRSAGLRVELLPELTDVDDIDSAHHVAECAPATSFRAALDGALRRPRRAS